MKRILVYLAAFLIGILPGFFIVFNSVFTDSNGNIGERFFTFLLVIVIFGVLGYLFGRLSSEKSITLGIMLSLPSIILLVLYLFKEPRLGGLILIYVVLTAGASYLGTTLGARR